MGNRRNAILSQNTQILENTVKFTIERKCKDSLAAFITEGILLKEQRPKVNTMCGNGFVT